MLPAFFLFSRVVCGDHAPLRRGLDSMFPFSRGDTAYSARFFVMFVGNGVPNVPLLWIKTKRYVFDYSHIDRLAPSFIIRRFFQENKRRIKTRAISHSATAANQKNKKPAKRTPPFATQTGTSLKISKPFYQPFSQNVLTSPQHAKQCCACLKSPFLQLAD